jgi:hypothetical protein
VSMYDDLDPMFTPSPATALENVAARVHELRVRRRVKIATALGAAVVVTALTSAAFASGGGKHAARISVSNDVTTTTEVAGNGTTDASTSTVTSAPEPTTTTVDTGSTTAGTGTASTDSSTPSTDAPSVGQTNTDGTTPTDTTPTETTPNDEATTTTTLPPADLHFVFSPAHLVIQGGTTATVSYTVTNDGDGPGRIGEPGCPFDELLADTASISRPRPIELRSYCASLRLVTIAPHSSTTFTHSVVAGQWDGLNDGLIPSPAGETTYVADCCLGSPQSLPVTITAPAQTPFSSTFPAQVTVASGAAHTETFTLTNPLGFAVEYNLEGPCMRLQGSTAPCGSTELLGGGIAGPWQNRIVVGANATVTLVADLSGTTDFMPPGFGNIALAPGTHQFWGPGGMPLTLTVTP